MKALHNIVSVIDIGSTKVCCCIANIINNENFDIIGVGYCICTGVKSGVIIDMDSVEKSISKAVENAEKMANYRVRSVYVNISGKNIESQILNVSLNIGGRIVTEEDVLQLFDYSNHDPDHREIIHSIPILYSIDSTYGIKDPLGMIANHLSVNINLVTAPKTQLNNILICLAKCHLDAAGVLATGYASGLFVMDEADMLNCQIVIDFGGGATSIAFFYNGLFCGSKIIPLGGKHITNDIAYGLNISIANAERLKTLHGSAFVSMGDHREMIFAPVIEDYDVINLQQIPKSALNQLIQPRVEEILNEINKKINASAFGSDFSRNIIITGGGSLLTGLKDFAGNFLNKKIKSKKMDDFIDGIDVQISNDFSVALGMIKFAQLSDYNLLKIKSSNKNNKKNGFFKKISLWIENNL